MATCCIQVPMSEMPCPAKKSRKLRCARARSVWLKFMTKWVVPPRFLVNSAVRRQSQYRSRWMDVRVNLGPRSYDIAVRSADLPGFRAFVRERSQTRRAFVITDFHVLPHGEQIT